MGIKAYYILDINGRKYRGPKAYYALLDVYKQAYPTVADRMIGPRAGWRRAIRKLYGHVNDQGLAYGLMLQKIKVHKSKKLPVYKAVGILNG